MRVSALLVLVLFIVSCTSAADEIDKQVSAARNKNSKLPSTPDGMVIYRKNCVTCHGADGKLGLNGAKDLTASVLPLGDRVQIITNGKNLMTPFKALLTEEEIKAVAEYSITLTAQSVK